MASKLAFAATGAAFFCRNSSLNWDVMSAFGGTKASMIETRKACASDVILCCCRGSFDAPREEGVSCRQELMSSSQVVRQKRHVGLSGW